MKKKIVWLLVSCLMVVALLLVSCGPAVEEEEEVIVTTEEEEEVVVPEEEEEVAPAPEGPEYGGEIRIAFSSGIQGFDEALSLNPYTLGIHNEDLLTGDREKGPGGTGETSWIYMTLVPPHLRTGALATGWEVPDANTLIFNLRKGVRWHDKPPVNGREFVADDVVFTMNYIWSAPLAYHSTAWPYDQYIESVETPDKYTVVINCQPGKIGWVHEVVGDYLKILPHEVIDEYGDMNDWENVVGTGPFILTEHVPGGTTTLERNPDYWMKDVFHPENQLPYVDSVKILIIPDTSTRIAAMRTGKIDRLYSLNWEEAADLIKTNPELEYVKYVSSSTSALWMRVDKPELPAYDLRVRQALSMAIDRQLMVDTLYGGEAELLTFPVTNIPELRHMYNSLEELPESTRELYEYNPDKAKQLLAEAGYPDGFQCEVIAYSGVVDTISVLKDYWSKIGVDLDIVVKEYGAYVGMAYTQRYKEMIWIGANGSIPAGYIYLQPKSMLNFSKVDDPTINEAFVRISEDYFDYYERGRHMKEIGPYILEQSLNVQFPAPYTYTFWQPWVKDYYGEVSIGYINNHNWTGYVWLDQDMKEGMTGRR